MNKFCFQTCLTHRDCQRWYLQCSEVHIYLKRQGELMNKIKKYLGFPADSAYRIQIEQNLTANIFKTHTIFQLLILGCQILMLYSISTLPRGVFLKSRRTAYF